MNNHILYGTIVAAVGALVGLSTNPQVIAFINSPAYTVLCVRYPWLPAVVQALSALAALYAMYHHVSSSNDNPTVLPTTK